MAGKELSELVVEARYKFKVPVEAEAITPDKFAGKPLNEVRRLTVYEGNTRRELNDLFEVSGSIASRAEKLKIIIRGDASMVRRVGEGMTGGVIIAETSLSHYVGSFMAGGGIIVKGDVGSWVGMKMKGGSIEIHGDAGGWIGGCRRGEPAGSGMSGGTVIIHGNAGAEVGRGMKGGDILVEGDCDILVGVEMRGGTIGVKGDCKGKAGARMGAGRMVVSGKLQSGILPSFYIEGLRPKPVKVAGFPVEGPFYIFSGDVLADIKCLGRLFVSIPNNPELKGFERLLEGWGCLRL